MFCLLSDSFCGNVFKNPARYAEVKYPFLKYMSNNGGFKQTPDPVTFLGGFSSLCSWSDYSSWQVLLCSAG